MFRRTCSGIQGPSQLQITGMAAHGFGDYKVRTTKGFLGSAPQDGKNEGVSL